MTRVSTMQLNNLIVGSALSTQVQYSQAVTQEGTGLVATDFATLGGSNTNIMLNLEQDIGQAQTWASDATTVGNTTQSMYSAIGNMVTTVTTLESKISSAMASPTTTNLASAVQSLQQTLASEMNTTGTGGYLFAGSNTGVQPVNLTNYPGAGFSATSPDTNYYTGDDKVLSVQVSLQQTVSYGVTADNPAFEQAMRAMQATIAGATASNTTINGSMTATSPTAATSVTAGTFSINGGGTVTVTAGESLQNIAAGINAASGGTGVTATVVGTSSPYSLQVSSGSQTALTFTSLTGTTLSDLGLSDSTYTQSVQATLKAALGVANSAVTALSNLQETVAANSSQLSSSSQQQTTYVTYLQSSLSNVKDVDTAQAAANVSKYQTQLQASYMAVTQISKLNLAQYL
jgi:flagellar hook-associated protein 3 FlgL